MLALILAAAGAGAPDETVKPILDPVWEPLQASFATITRYYPADALQRGADDAVILDCRATKQGALRDCGVFREAPSGMGFGAAAASAAMALLHVKPVTKSGASIEGGLLRVAIRFRMPWSPPDEIDKLAAITVFDSTSWAQRPTAMDMARAFPERATRRGVEGDAIIHCRIGADGALGGCTVVVEHPSGEFFGAAALSLAPKFRFDVTKAPGRFAPGNEITIPIRFQLPTS